MLDAEIVDFIGSHYLPKGSELELSTFVKRGRSFEVDLFKTGSRTRRRIGKITGGSADDGNDDTYSQKKVPEALERLFRSPRARKTERDLRHDIHDSALWPDAIAEGWVMRIERYGADGKTVERTEYVMGYALHATLERKRRRAEEREKQAIANWLARLRVPLNKRSEDGNGPDGEENRRPLWNFIEDMAAKLEHCRGLHEVWEAIPGKGQASWQAGKRESYVDFMVALAEIAAVRDHFDWKEIGARYYREIGGSKRFDPYKEDFLKRAEEHIGCPLPLLGLWSAGAVTPIFFAGELSGNGGFSYPQGFLHAVTDVTVFQTKFRTGCRALWLTENRAVLTRMSAEPSFLRNSDSLIIGLDGQLRSGHRKLIQDVLTGSAAVGQILVWCDGDRAGLDISRHVHALLRTAAPSAAAVKWILPAGRGTGEGPASRVFRTWDAYEAAAYAGLDQSLADEQEAEMGDTEIWNIWMEV